MKIIIIGTVASSIYTFRLGLIRALTENGCKVYVFISEYNQSDLQKIKGLGVEPITYKLNRGGLNPLADIITTYRLSKQIKNIQPDIVFSYFVKPVIFGTLAAKFANVPKVIGMLEGLGYMFTEQPEGLRRKTCLIKNIQIFLYRIALPKLDKLIFLNPDDPKDLLDHYAISVKSVDVLGGIGLDLADYAYTPISTLNSPINFLFIGRLLKEKGIHDFVAAVKLVKYRYPNTLFTVVGSIDTNNLGALSQNQLDELTATGLIIYLGQVDNVADWIAKCHVFVLPSYREGVPRSTQEAMAMGRAIITTDVPGCRETVIDGLNGFLVPKWNPQALAEKMIYFIENTDEIRRMGNESHKLATQRFDAKKVNERLLKLMDI